MKIQHPAVIASLTVVGTVLTGCSANSGIEMKHEDATLTGTVLAIRLSPQLYSINAGATDGYVILVDDQGNVKSLEVGPMDIGQLAWTDSGLFISGPTDEYLLSDTGLTTFPRSGPEEAYEWGRFTTPDNKGFISVYNAGFGDGVYLSTVATGDASGIDSWSLHGMPDALSQCGDRVFAIANIEDTTIAPDPDAFLTEALIQVYPQPASNEAAILATLPLTDSSLITTDLNALCVDDVIYAFSYEWDQPEWEGLSRPVLRAWNTVTGEHTVTPLVTPENAPLDLAEDNGLPYGGSIVNDSYLWAAPSGDVYSTELTSGISRLLFSVPIANPEAGAALWTFTETSVFVVDIPSDQEQPFDFSRYDLATGQRTKLMTITGLEKLHDGLNMVARDLAINPEWLKANQ